MVYESRNNTLTVQSEINTRGQLFPQHQHTGLFGASNKLPEQLKMSTVRLNNQDLRTQAS